MSDSERGRPTDVARITSLSVRKVQELAAGGKIPSAVRGLDNSWSFDLREVRSWVKSQEIIQSQVKRNTERERKIHKIKMVNKISSSLINAAEILANAIPAHTASSGIYFLIDDGQIVYVGRSVEVSSRVASHMKSKKFDAWFWVPCKKSELEATERAYIAALMPKLNKDTLTAKARRAA